MLLCRCQTALNPLSVSSCCPSGDLSPLCMQANPTCPLWWSRCSLICPLMYPLLFEQVTLEEVVLGARRPVFLPFVVWCHSWHYQQHKVGLPIRRFRLLLVQDGLYWMPALTIRPSNGIVGEMELWCCVCVRPNASKNLASISWASNLLKRSAPSS